MAIPPPHAFINVREARWLRPDRLELQFDHPRPLPGLAPFFVEIHRDGPATAEGYAPLALGLFERRTRHGEPRCDGAVLDPCIEVDIRPLLPEAGIQRGRITFNDASLYGRHRRLEPFGLELDLTQPPTASSGRADVDPDAAMNANEALLARVLPAGEQETWGWLPLAKPGATQRWERLALDAITELDAGGLRQDRVLGLIRLVPQRGTLELLRYSYYGDDSRLELRPDANWWLDASFCLWPLR